MLKTASAQSLETGESLGRGTTMVRFVFQAEHRTMTAFILAVIVNSYTTGQVSVIAAPGTADLSQTQSSSGVQPRPHLQSEPLGPLSRQGTGPFFNLNETM